MMLAATAVGVVTAPVVLPAAAMFDLVRGRRRLPSVRSGLFALRYLVNDSTEIVVAPLLWAGRRRNRAAGVERYRAVQAWSIRTLADAADHWVGVRLDPDVELPVESGTGPYIVLCRHASMLDSSVPSLLFGLGSAWRVRGVAASDALADPGFDLIYPTLGTVFIDRDEGASAKRIIAGFAQHDGPDDVVTIYPEGRIFQPALLAGSLERLGERSPERAERLSGLRNILPPRPGGTLALLDALPTADVLVIGHVGFEGAASIGQIVGSAPLDTKVQLLVRHVPRNAIPDRAEDRITWLDDVWLDLDHWITSILDATTNSGGPATAQEWR